MNGLYWNRRVLGPPIIWLVALPHVLVVGAAGWYVISEYHAIVLYSDEAAGAAWMAFEPSFFWPNDDGWNLKWSEVARPLYAYLSMVSTILLLIAPLNMMFLLEVFPRRWVQGIETKNAPERAKKKSAFGIHLLVLLWLILVFGAYSLPGSSYGRHRWLSCSDESFLSCVSTHVFVSSFCVLCTAYIVWVAREIYMKRRGGEEPEE